MSPEESGIDAAAARMAWQMHSGWSATRVYLWWRSEYPLTDPGFLDRALAQAEEMRAVSERLQTLAPEDPILEAYERPLPLDQPIGIRYAVEIDTNLEGPVWRSFAINVLPETTRAEVEALIRSEVEEHLRTRPTSIAYGASIPLQPDMVPINALFTRLPERI